MNYEVTKNDTVWEAAVSIMDGDIREQIHRELAPCTKEEFLDRYCELHEEKYREEFEPAKENGCW